MAIKFYDHLDADIKTILLAQVRNLWTHNSTSLEGNSLTLGETDFILQEGLTIQGKPLKDHNEVYGHAKAIERIYTLLNTSKPITKQDLFQLHETVLTERITDIDQPVGLWKTQSNYTNTINNNKQVWREYPAPRHIDFLMQQWLDKINAYMTTALDSDAAVNAYADCHLSFVTIHPFFDGNGHMARLLANLPVLNSGLPPIVIPQEDRFRYQRCLSDYQNTIDDLAELSDLSLLPLNDLRQQFKTVCQGYWAQTLSLLDEANAIQAKRLAIPK